MARRRHPAVRAIAAYATIVFVKITRLLPTSVAYGVSGLLGRVAYYVVPRIRRVGLENLDRAYGASLRAAEKRRILRGAVQNVARVAAEFSRMPDLAAGGFAGHVTIRGQEHLDLSRGCLIAGGHLGNWEWMAPAMASCGYRVAEVVRPLDDRRLNAVVDATRRGGGILTIPKDDAGGEMLRLLKAGWMVGVLIDQSPRQNAVPASFFGALCWATIAPAMIAVRAKVPVHPVSMVRDKGGCYTLEFYPALEMVHTGNFQEDLVVNTQRCQEAFEQVVRAHPEQWLWFHRRWKARPRLDAEWQARQARHENPPA